MSYAKGYHHKPRKSFIGVVKGIFQMSKTRTCLQLTIDSRKLPPGLKPEDRIYVGPKRV